MSTPWLAVHPEVAEALASGRPVVALESTLIAHGLPHPQNVEIARRLEAVVRETGAVPATVAVLDGRLRVGLEHAELEHLAQGYDLQGNGIRKLSRRDLPIALACKQDGATTVAATMIAAHLAGIRVFATGGIGGVHRGAAQTFDISADLQELGRTPVAVVCAGAKSILDLTLTIEYLETHGVPLLGYRTKQFPAFFTRESSLPVDERVEDPTGLARIIHCKWQLGLGGGVVVANPIPEDAALEGARVERAIEQALEEAEHGGIVGKTLTPVVLERIRQLTGGESLHANVELVGSNARLAGQLATELLRLET